MSINHYIKTKKTFDFETIKQRINELQDENIRYQQRGSDLCYFWYQEGCTRGVDVSIEEESWIKIRNTICSNQNDYIYSNLLANIICKEFDGTPYIFNDDFDEDEIGSKEYLPTSLPLFDIEKTQGTFINDCNTIKAMVSYNGQTVTLFSPIRQTHIGKNFLEKHKSLSDANFADELEKLILTINYGLPDWNLGNVLEFSQSDEETKVMKLITNEAPYVLEKFDYLTFPTEDGNMILITNDNLNKILPDEWILVDEYTIVAPIISDDSFQELMKRAEKFNESDVLK